MKKFVAAVFIYGDKLVVQRRDDKAPNNPNLLGFFGGRIEKDETPLQALRREMAEETSLGVEKLQFKELFEVTIPVGNVDSEQGLDTAFLCRLESVDFQLKEGAGIELFLLDELLARTDLAPFSQVIAREVKRRKSI